MLVGLNYNQTIGLISTFPGPTLGVEMSRTGVILEFLIYLMWVNFLSEWSWALPPGDWMRLHGASEMSGVW